MRLTLTDAVPTTDAEIRSYMTDLLALHRATFGSLVMEADDTAATEAAATAAAEQAATEAAEQAAQDALGDPGKKALDAMKADRNSAREEARLAKVSLDALQAKVDGREAEHTANAAAQVVKDEALAGANTRILKAEVRAAAAGMLADPADALRFLDLSALEVGADGEVDGTAVTALIEDLLTKKPYLAAQGGQRFKGGADGGTRKESSASIDDQIAAASAAGNIQLSIALKQQRAASLATS